MDKLILELDGFTNCLVSRIDEMTYTDLLEVIDQRDENINLIIKEAQHFPLSDIQKVKLQEILNKDEIILERLTFYKNEASDWLRQRDNAKTQRNAYESNFFAESILVDRKK